jgi:hypothetical protein
VLFKLLGLPLTLPAAGIRYCLDRVVEMAEHEADSEEPIKEELLELQLALEEGTIDERAFSAREAVLFARLREIRERHKALAREEAAGSGGSVVVELPEELR